MAGTRSRNTFWMFIVAALFAAGVIPANAEAQRGDPSAPQLQQARPPRSPDGPPPPQRDAVAVAMGDSYISGQGAGNYERNGPDWNGSIEDPGYCDRSPDAAIHLAELPGIDKTYNVACSGATVSDITLRSGARAAVASQIDQLVEIAESETEQVELIQFSVGGNNRSFYFGKILSACVNGFILDGYTSNGATLYLAELFGISNNRWYGSHYSGNTENDFQECTDTKLGFFAEGVQTATIQDATSAMRDLRQTLMQNNSWTGTTWGALDIGGFEHPADEALWNDLLDYETRLYDTWFASDFDDLPLMILPLPTAVLESIDTWESIRGADGTQLGTAYQLRGIRLLKEWAHKVNRVAWENVSWTLSHYETQSRLGDLGAAAGIPVADRFPPKFEGQQVTFSDLRAAYWVPRSGPSREFIVAEGQAVADAVEQLIDAMSDITTDGQQRYPVGSYRIVLQDYTSPFAPEMHEEWRRHWGDDQDNRFKKLVRKRYGAGCPVHEATAAWAGEQTEHLRDMIEAAATRVRLSRPGHDVVRLNVVDAMNGARLCETANPSDWMISPVRFSKIEGTTRDVLHDMDALTTGALSSNDELPKRCLYWSFQACQDSGHPNIEGNRSIAKCVTAAWLLSTDMVDCDRVGSVMKANGHTITTSIGEVQLHASAGNPSETLVDDSGSCDYVEFELPVTFSVVDPSDTGVWNNASFSASVSVDGATSVTFNSSTNRVSGQAPCSPFETYQLYGTVTAISSSGESVTAAVSDFFVLQGDRFGDV